MRKNFILILFITLHGVVIAQKNVAYNLIMRSNFGNATLWDNQVVRIYGFTQTLGGNPTLPGPILYVEEGDSLIINAANISQSHIHTVHLHGMDADTKNDGDPMTAHPIFHGQTKTYRVLADHAGTYMYHCHVEDVVHVQMGMYGLLVVKAAGGVKTAWTGGPAFDNSYNWLTSELDKSWHDVIPVVIDDTLKIPEYKPHYFLINGKSEQQIDADDSIKINGAENEHIYVRIANIGYFRNKVIFPSALNAKIIDSDGRPLPNAITNDTIEVMPGERYGILLNPVSQFTDSIKMSYINTNTDSVWNTQHIPVIISGIYSVKEIEMSSMINAFPNPAKNYVNINLTTPEKYKIVTCSIVNSLGQIVLQEDKSCLNNGFKVDISPLKEGLYFIQITTDNVFYSKKLLIVK